MRPVDSKETAELLRAADNVLILTHKNSDGDTLGCGTALCRALLELGKKARIENSDDIPSKYDYMFEGIPELDFEPDYIVAVDIADTKLLGSKLEVYKDRIDLCIDHHGSNLEYADNLLLRADDGAASLTLYRVLKELGTTITPEIAADLYTGLSTDTGCFRYSNAGVEEYIAAAELIEAGADNADINVRMFETKPYAYFEMLKEVLDGMRLFYDGKVSVLKVTQDMLKRTGATEDQCDAIAALSRQIEGVKCGVTMKQKKDGTYKFSLRTHEPLDASAICRLLGGGGHARAAGCDAGADEEAALQTMLDYIGRELQK